MPRSKKAGNETPEGEAKIKGRAKSRSPANRPIRIRGFTGMITLTEVHPSVWRIVYENGVCLGHALQEVDGYFYFYPEEHGGFWVSCVIRLIADHLDELNEPWDQELALMLSKQPIPNPTGDYYNYCTCESPGLTGTTPITLKQSEAGWIARMGFALFGASNMDEEGFKKVGYNPFHPEFHDNYAEGKGGTESAAVADLKKNVQELHKSLW